MVLFLCCFVVIVCTVFFCFRWMPAFHRSGALANAFGGLLCFVGKGVSGLGLEVVAVLFVERWLEGFGQNVCGVLFALNSPYPAISA